MIFGRKKPRIQPWPDERVRKLNVGCGENKLPGWANYDADLDICRPLPFAAQSIDFILAEHVVEHVHVHDAYRFFRECYRVLKPGGVLRLCIPGIDRIVNNWNPQYGELIQKGGFGDNTRQGSIEAILFKHGHQAAWTEELLCMLLRNLGFAPQVAEPRKSSFPELNDVDGHWRMIGEDANRVESIVVDAVRA